MYISGYNRDQAIHELRLNAEINAIHYTEKEWLLPRGVSRGAFRVAAWPDTTIGVVLLGVLNFDRTGKVTPVLVQRQFLYPQIADLANVQRIFVATVDGIDRSELLR
jgi:hypothetical protein